MPDPARSDPSTLATALAGAARDAGLPVELLGDFPAVLAAGRRPSAEDLGRYRDLGVQAADAGAPLPALVDLYLSAAWRAWPTLPPVSAAVAADDAGAVGAVAESVLRAADDAVAALTEGWQDARRQAARREEATRRALVDDLLGGSGDVGTLLDRAEGFGLLLSAPHVVLAVAGDRVLDDGDPVIREAEAALLTPGRAGGLLVAAKDGLLAGVVPAGRASSEAAAAPARRLADRLATRHSRSRWRVAVSRPRTGAAGVRQGWHDVTEALAVAERLDLTGPVVPADDLLAYSLLLRDRAAVSDLVRRTLGPLAAARGGAAPLVETLLAVFDAGGNTTAAARDLHVSVRAVLYRLDRVVRLTGFALTEPTQRFTLQAAAVGARLLDWPAQPLDVAATSAEGMTGSPP